MAVISKAHTHTKETWLERADFLAGWSELSPDEHFHILRMACFREKQLKFWIIQI